MVASTAIRADRYLRFSHPLVGEILQTFLLVDNRLVPPIIQDDHVILVLVVVIGLYLAIGKVHDETPIESRCTLRAEVAMVKVGAGLQPSPNHELVSVEKNLRIEKSVIGARAIFSGEK